MTPDSPPAAATSAFHAHPTATAAFPAPSTTPDDPASSYLYPCATAIYVQWRCMLFGMPHFLEITNESAPSEKWCFQGSKDSPMELHLYERPSLHCEGEKKIALIAYFM